MSTEHDDVTHRPLWIDLEGASNVRDVGGLPARGGRTRPGVLLRADALDALSPGDVAELAGRRGLRHVVDLRTPGERAERGRGLLGDHAGVRHSELPVIDDEQLEARRLARAERLAAGEATTAIMADGYAQLLEWGGRAFVTALHAALDDDGVPVLVHCSAGKDRTGVLVALLLGAAGVERDAIVADYAATAGRMDGVVERLRTSAQFAGAMEAMGGFTFDAEAGTMQRLLDHLDDGWGGPAGWLRHHGVSEVDLDRWRGLLIEAT
jgi:protein-tyrosine phosphatase